MNNYIKEYIIVDEVDALDLQEISSMESVKFYQKLPSGQYLYDFMNNELSDLAKYQQKNPVEYAQRMNDDEEFEKRCLNIINTRRILTSKGSENYMKRYYTYTDNISNVVFDYLSFKRYMHQIFVEINKKTTIEFEYARMKKQIDILLSWIADINISYKVETLYWDTHRILHYTGTPIVFYIKFIMCYDVKKYSKFKKRRAL